ERANRGSALQIMHGSIPASVVDVFPAMATIDLLPPLIGLNHGPFTCTAGTTVFYRRDQGGAGSSDTAAQRRCKAEHRSLHRPHFGRQPAGHVAHGAGQSGAGAQCIAGPWVLPRTGPPSGD